VEDLMVTIDDLTIIAIQGISHYLGKRILDWIEHFSFLEKVESDAAGIKGPLVSI